MKKLKITAILMMLILLCAVPAMAASVSGKIMGSAIEVTWQAPSGACELTVLQNDWPIWVGNVNGGCGGVTIPVNDPAGRYDLRLRTAEGCFVASVSGSKATAEPTPVVTEKPTEVATVQPTENPTEAPEVKPTAAPTAKPTEEPTAKPTEAPTARPTVAPTAKPTQTPVSMVNRDDLATQVLNLVNQERAARGLSALRMDSELTRAACVRAGEIAQSFSHTRPDGSSWSTVSSSAYGENIAMGQQTAEKVIAAWMTSTGHRENILRASYGSIGICAIKSNGVMYWVQLFGK